MRLTNYWWLLIWLFCAGGFLYWYFPRQKVLVNGKYEERWTWLPAIILAAPYVVWAAYRTVFGDTEVYRETFLALPDKISKIIPYISEYTKDKGFSVLSILMKSMIGNKDIDFFLLIAVFQMLCIVYVYKQYSSNYWLSFFLFIISTDYMSWMHNGMRQFIAVTMILAAFKLLVEKKYVPLIIVILLASTIHGTALMMLPIVFIVQGRAWNTKTILFILAVVLMVELVDQFTPILTNVLADTQYSDLTANEIWTGDDGTNLLRVLVYSVPALLSLWGKRYIDVAKNPMINICVNCSIVTMALYLLSAVTSGIYIGRLPIYTTLQGYMAVPWLIDNMFEEKSARMIIIVMMGAYLLFFFYQMHMSWGLL